MPRFSAALLVCLLLLASGGVLGARSPFKAPHRALRQQEDTDPAPEVTTEKQLACYVKELPAVSRRGRWAVRPGRGEGFGSAGASAAAPAPPAAACSCLASPAASPRQPLPAPVQVQDFACKILYSTLRRGIDLVNNGTMQEETILDHMLEVSGRNGGHWGRGGAWRHTITPRNPSAAVWDSPRPSA